MIIGEYKQKIGEKNRIALPKKFREELGNKLIITRGYEGCLIVMSPAQWEEMTNDSIQGPFVSSMIRDTRRFLFAGATEIELDAQGRFVIPPFLLEYSALSEEGVFLGLGQWVEIWNIAKWNKKLNEIGDQSSEIADRLAKTGDKNV